MLTLNEKKKNDVLSEIKVLDLIKFKIRKSVIWYC